MTRGIVGTVLSLSTQVEEPQLWPLYHENIPENIAALARFLCIQCVASCYVISYFLGNWKTV